MEIFKLFGSIMVNSSEAEKSISNTGAKAEKLASKLGKGITTAAKWGAGIAAGATAAAGAMLGVAKKSAEAADEIDKMSQKIGLSKKSYQEWDYAMGQSGVDIGVMQSGVKTLTSLMDKAKDGNASAKASFEELGLSIYDSSGALKSQEDMMREAIMALADMEDSTERAKLSTELFGKAGTELEPLLNSGSAGIQELMDRAHELGLVMSDEAVNAGVKFGDTLADVKSSIGMIGTTIGVAVMPMIQTLLDWVIEHMPEILETVNGVINGIKDGVAALQAFWDEHGDAITAKVESVMAIVKKVVQLGMDVLKELINVAMAILEGDWAAAWDGIVNIVKNIGSALYEAGKAIFTRLWDGIKSVWEDIQGWVSEKIGWLLDKLKFWDDGKSQMDDNPAGRFSHASGLPYVPYDNYPANLHKNEVIVNDGSARSLLDDVRKIAAGSGGGGTQTINLSIELDGTTLARKMYTYNQAETNRRGGSLVTA